MDAQRLTPILPVNIKDERVPGLAQQREIGPTEHQTPRVRIGSRRRQISRFGQWQKIRYMHIGEVHLLAEPITANLLVELHSQSGIKSSRVLIKRGFENCEGVWCTQRKLEIE